MTGTIDKGRTAWKTEGEVKGEAEILSRTDDIGKITYRLCRRQENIIHVLLGLMSQTNFNKFSFN